MALQAVKEKGANPHFRTLSRDGPGLGPVVLAQAVGNPFGSEAYREERFKSETQCSVSVSTRSVTFSSSIFRLARTRAMFL